MITRSCLSLTLATGLGLFLLGCSSGGSGKPGVLNVHWTNAPATCEIRHLTRIRVTVMQGSTEVQQKSVSCPRGDRGTTGTVTIDPIDPGTYTVQVGGIDSGGNEPYAGTNASVKVPSGGIADTDVINLELRPASLVVDWDLGAKCSTKGITDVQVRLYDAKGGTLTVSGGQKNPFEVGCDYTHKDPKTGERATGVLYTGLDPARGAIAVVYGIDANGNDTYTGQSDPSHPIELMPGQQTKVTVLLQRCTKSDPQPCKGP